MENNPEFEYCLSEIVGQSSRKEDSVHDAIQKSTAAIDRFFQTLEFGKVLYGSEEPENISNREVSMLDDLRQTIEREKGTIPTMTVKQMRLSMVAILRKTADTVESI
jgi:hypothetical protein